MEARNQHFGLGGARDAVVLVNCWRWSCFLSTGRGRGGGSVILFCSDCAEEKEWWHLPMIFRTDRSVVLRVKAGIPLRKTTRQRESIKQIKTEGTEELWSDVHTEPDRQSQSEGHNKVDANRRTGHHVRAINMHKGLQWSICSLWCTPFTLLIWTHALSLQEAKQAVFFNKLYELQ